MSVFALPITATSTIGLSAGTKSVRYKVKLPLRKRKRESPPHVEEELDSLSDDGPYRSAASTNPLSLTPAEIAQYKLAGLELDEQLPTVRDFPHRGLPTSKLPTPRRKKVAKGKGPAKHDEDTDTSGDEAGVEEEDELKPPRNGPGSQLRLQHFRVLVAILHRCLMERDIQRAMRAWAILIRVKFHGQMLDIRSTGYWAIGAELLARAAEKSGQNIEDSGNENEETPSIGNRAWGTKTGRAQAVEYLGKLILEFPYNKQYWKSISAVDFWPSMLAIEIYGIQYEQKRALKEIADDLVVVETSEESEATVEEDSSSSESDNSFVAMNRKAVKHRRRKEERAWLKREETRNQTLSAAESLAMRVDELLSEPLYTANNTISEIRAHLALYIGDLSVPEMPLEDDEDDLEHGLGRSRSRLGDADQRLLHQQRITDHKRGQRKREEEIERATAIVNKLIRNGGNAEDFKGLDLDYLEGEPEVAEA